jgi:hypothetical protein
MSYPLSGIPLGGQGPITVAVNGAIVSSSSWTYDVTSNQIVFVQAAPQPGDTVSVTYPVGCE